MRTGERGGSREDFHQFLTRSEYGMGTGGGGKLQIGFLSICYRSWIRNQHWGRRGGPKRIYISLGWESRKKYDIVLYMFFLLVILQEHNKHYYYNVFLASIIPEHTKHYYYNVSLALYAHIKYYVVNVFHVFYASKTQTTLFCQCVSFFLWSQNTKNWILLMFFHTFYALRTQTTLFCQCVSLFLWSQNTENIFR